jgi:AraC-like DNA-binding protein
MSDRLSALFHFDATRGATFMPPYAGLFICPGEGRHAARTMNSYELIFVRRGLLHIAEENERFVVKPNQVLLLRKNMRHVGTRAYPAELTFYWLHFDTPRSRLPITKLTALPRQTALSEPERLAELFQRFLHDRECGVLTPSTAGLLITLMLCEVAHAASPPHREPTGASLAAQAARIVARHYRERLSTADVAELLRCNPDYLGRVFRVTYGYTVTDAIHRRRVFEARILLSEESLIVDEIAQRCGFGSTSYMCKIFGREVGMTPSQYRRVHSRYPTTINTI